MRSRSCTPRPPANVGSVVEDHPQRLTQATVADAHDPPLLGAEHDRAPRRGESYVKDFKPLKMGVMELKAAGGAGPAGDQGARARA